MSTDFARFTTFLPTAQLRIDNTCTDMANALAQMTALKLSPARIHTECLSIAWNPVDLATTAMTRLSNFEYARRACVIMTLQRAWMPTLSNSTTRQCADWWICPTWQRRILHLLTTGASEWCIDVNATILTLSEMAERIACVFAAFQRFATDFRAKMHRIEFLRSRTTSVRALMYTATLPFLTNLLAVEHFAILVNLHAFNLSSLTLTHANLLDEFGAVTT